MTWPQNVYSSSSFWPRVETSTLVSLKICKLRSGHDTEHLMRLLNYRSPNHSCLVLLILRHAASGLRLACAIGHSCKRGTRMGPVCDFTATCKQWLTRIWIVWTFRKSWLPTKCWAMLMNGFNSFLFAFSESVETKHICQSHDVQCSWTKGMDLGAGAGGSVGGVLIEYTRRQWVERMLCVVLINYSEFPWKNDVRTWERHRNHTLITESMHSCLWHVGIRIINPHDMFSSVWLWWGTNRINGN